MSNTDRLDPRDPPFPAGYPDPHGEAALVLVESLIHGILARGGLSLSETLDIAQAAVDVQIEFCAERSEEPRSAPSVRYLRAIAASLRIDADTGASRIAAATTERDRI
jgi:hypothetical protein